MGLKRRRIKQTNSLQDRLAQSEKHMRKRAHAEPIDAEKNELLKKVRNAEQTVDIERQLRQPHSGGCTPASQKASGPTPEAFCQCSS
ncbi:hypothetical protein GGD66_007990 [Bradyrhizobium sp. CIR48]|nr:hypothetical protein [Bradyrhizobium sp. CIR18]MBB4429388.1 hypothetical protein [Bradyrhizobium sp. CIR48]